MSYQNIQDPHLSWLDMRMTLDKTLEPQFLAPFERQFLEALRQGHIGDAFLTLSLMAKSDDKAVQFTSQHALLCYANALRSPNLDISTSFLLEHGCALALHDAEILMEYFLLSSLEGASQQDAASIQWLLARGFYMRNEHGLAARVLRDRFPQLHCQNRSKIEQIVIDELLTTETPQVREADAL